jgi:hypothetical protein
MLHGVEVVPSSSPIPPGLALLREVTQADRVMQATNPPLAAWKSPALSSSDVHRQKQRTCFWCLIKHNILRNGCRVLVLPGWPCCLAGVKTRIRCE